MKPLLLQSKRKPVNGYDHAYVEREQKAIAKAGFEVIELEAGIFGMSDAPDHDLTGRPVFCRHYANEDHYFIPYIEAHGGYLVVPDYHVVADWYKILPLDFMVREFMGGRKMGWYSLKPYGFLEEQDELKAFRALIDEVFDQYSIGGKVFAKSETKNSFAAKVYNKEDLWDTLVFLIGVGCHRTPQELIVSQPIDIVRHKGDYKVDEYRCLIVNGKVSTTSFYTDKPSTRDYWEVNQFANRFAQQFAQQLPSSYDLDICRMTNGQLAVVELNDISACGFFADHDLDKLFKDIHKLAIKTLQKH